MRSLRLVSLGTLALILVALSGICASASAHHADLYSQSLRPADNYRVDVYFRTNVPGGTTRSRITNGMQPWNSLGRQHVFVPHRAAIDQGYGGGGTGDCSVFVNGDDAGLISWEYINGPYGVAALNIGPCREEEGLGGFVTIYDRSEPWNLGTDNTADSEVDLWSVATHEFGHAAGAKHYKRDDPKEPCEGSGPHHTMCAKTPAGTDYVRDLAEHDIHTFKRVYGPR